MAELSEARVDRWERRTAWPLTGLAALFVVAYAVPVLRPDLDPRWRVLCEAVTLASWALIGADYLVRLFISRNRRAFVRSHLLDLAVLVLPVLRPLKMLRLLTALLVLNRRAEAWTRGRLAMYVATASMLIVMVAGVAILDAEQGAEDGNIDNYQQALWWAVVTITTVGYGDHYPTTVAGRLVATGLMIGGIGLIGFVTGSLASWIVERVADVDPSVTRTDLADLTAEIRALRSEVDSLRTAAGGAAGGGRPDDVPRGATGDSVAGPP